MVDLERLLNSVGKKIFVDYYSDFKQFTDKKAFAEKLLRENPNAKSLGGQLTRINCASRIFENNLQIQALQIVIDSKLEDGTIEKAMRLKAVESRLA